MNRYTTPVLFSFEKNLTILSLHAIWGNNGVPVLDTKNSKGICNFAIDAVALNGNTVASSSTVSSVTSFSGLFNGMTVAGPGIGSAVTISSMTAGTGSIVLSSGTNNLTVPGGLLTATGGRFRVQFGQLAAQRLDPYAKLLGVSYEWFMTGSAAGSATTLQLAPAAPEMFVVSNRTQNRTIPQTLTSGSTDCSLVLQFGTPAAAGAFVATNPAPSEGIRMLFVFGNSTAP